MTPTRLTALLCLLAAPALAGDVLVVAPKELQPALAEWKAHREGQGHEVIVRAPAEDADGLARIVGGAGARLEYVLLLGDAKAIPFRYEKGVAIKPYERDARIANDNWLADRDGDGAPELAIGRLPADDLAEARAMLDKILAYERNTDFGPWRRRANIVAGVGGFGFFQDAAIEAVTTKLLKDVVSPAYDLHVTFANPSSPFCPPPASIRDVTLERFNEGALIVTYIGHGSRDRLDRLRWGRRSFRIFDEDDAYSLESRRGAPIAYFCACSTGHFDGAPDSLAEVVLKQPRGPVAVLAASRVSMPYANAILSKEILEAMLVEKEPTLGAVLRRAKRRLANPEEGDRIRQLVEIMAFAYKPKERDRRIERNENLWLFNLLGDPLLRLPHPARATLAASERATAGETVVITVESPVAGEALVELSEERTPAVPPRADDEEVSFRRAYARSNDWVRVARTTGVEKGTATRVELPLPEDLSPGQYHARVWVTGKRAAASGSVPVWVHGPR